MGSSSSSLSNSCPSKLCHNKLRFQQEKSIVITDENNNEI